MPLVLLLRPGEFRMASWAEIDFDKPVRTIPAARMKRVKAGKVHGKPHNRAPLDPALQILRDLHFEAAICIGVFRESLSRLSRVGR